MPDDSTMTGRVKPPWLLIGIAAIVAAVVAIPVAVVTTFVVVSSTNQETASEKGTVSRRNLEIFEQEGKVTLIAGEAGAVGFPLPYAEPPNVVISKWNGRKWEESEVALITEITRSGFKWKCVGKPLGGRDELQWTAKGVKATTIQQDRP